MNQNYLNSRNTSVIAEIFQFSFNSHAVGKFAIEEWFLKQGKGSKNALERLEQHFTKTCNVCNQEDYEIGNKLIGFTMNGAIYQFFRLYVAPKYEELKAFIYDEMDNILHSYVCESPEELIRDLYLEADPQIYDMNHLTDHLFFKHILRSKYREEGDRYHERFPLNWNDDKRNQLSSKQ
jgi:hypothetical protein